MPTNDDDVVANSVYDDDYMLCCNTHRKYK